MIETCIGLPGISVLLCISVYENHATTAASTVDLGKPPQGVVTEVVDQLPRAVAKL